MKTRVHFYETFDPIVNQEKRTVVVRVVGELFLDRTSGLGRLFADMKSVSKFIKSLPSYVEYPGGLASLAFEGVGVAKCAPEDEFNVELGQKLADTRAQRQVFVQVQQLHDAVTRFVRNEYMRDVWEVRIAAMNERFNCLTHEKFVTGAITEEQAQRDQQGVVI